MWRDVMRLFGKAVTGVFVMSALFASPALADDFDELTHGADRDATVEAFVYNGDPVINPGWVVSITLQNSMRAPARSSMQSGF
jgi:hypothetical protein